MKNRNHLNGKQYSYGYKEWLWKICIELDFKDKVINTAYKQLDTDAWLVYFMDGLSPRQAVKIDFSNA